MAARLDPDLRHLDVAAFAAASGERSGEWPTAGFTRLPASPAESDAAPDPVVAWRVTGRMAAIAGAGVQPQLRIEAGADLVLQCQRCLQPLPLAVRADRRIGFVEGEDAAAALDAESDDDVLALAPVLDVHVLVEDELLLALPLVPRHDVCPDPPRLRDPDDDAVASALNPFAVLAALKRGAPPN